MKRIDTQFLVVGGGAAGFAFEGLLVRPFWNFLFRFASTPAQTATSEEPVAGVERRPRHPVGDGVGRVPPVAGVRHVVDPQLVQPLGEGAADGVDLDALVMSWDAGEVDEKGRHVR